MTTRTLKTCNHQLTDNHRCGSPAMRGEAFCYYHHPTRKPALTRRARRGFYIPPPTDFRTRQQALGEIIQRVAANQLDVHRASIMLYALQVAQNPG